MPVLQVEDIQGIILRGYGALHSACFLLLKIDDALLVKDWLARLPLRDSMTRPEPRDSCINIAFTPTGLHKLGVPDEQLLAYAGEFNEGIAGTAHRSRILGDHGESGAENWNWGGPHNGALDLLLLCYAGDDAALDALLEREIGDGEAHGLHIVERLSTHRLNNRKEHFGFRDGVGQPNVEGFDVGGPQTNIVAAGEFVLGYPNAYGQYTDRPTVAAAADPRSLLPAAPDDAARRDLGMNGSYLVLRQLSQDVGAFWGYMAEQASTKLGGDPAHACIALASKMVGRWPSGAPLVKAPLADDPALADDNDFSYVRSGDALGLKCPLGSHVRRTNPRDALDPHPGSDRSIEVGNRHRIIRRGRAYGPPVVESVDPAEMIGKAQASGEERGLHFICFNTQIGRQFEFIQHTWMNSAKFDGLYEDDDPLVGARGDAAPAGGGAGTFTVQHEPVRKRFTGMPRFVTVRGGGYFFMPGVRAVRYIASL